MMSMLGSMKSLHVDRGWIHTRQAQLRKPACSCYALSCRCGCSVAHKKPPRAAQSWERLEVEHMRSRVVRADMKPQAVAPPQMSLDGERPGTPVVAPEHMSLGVDVESRVTIPCNEASRHKHPCQWLEVEVATGFHHRWRCAACSCYWLMLAAVLLPLPGLPACGWVLQLAFPQSRPMLELKQQSSFSRNQSCYDLALS